MNRTKCCNKYLGSNTFLCGMPCGPECPGREVLAKMPDIVREVHLGCVVLSKKNGLSDEEVYTRQNEEGEWCVGSNFETWPFSFVYRNEKWYLRNRWDGEDSECNNILGEVDCLYG